MAAMIRHGFFKTAELASTKNVTSRCFATKAEKRKGLDRKVGPEINSSAQSLAAKGFLRSQKEYNPPKDLSIKLNGIFHSVVGKTDAPTKITDLKQRFELFTACEREFQHCIPNSLLHTVQTLEDVQKFYETRVDLSTPLDKMRNMELPENVHIQFEYHRFHPDTDTKFGGLTAFNESSTFVTGLKSKEKYQGHKQKIKMPSV